MKKTLSLLDIELKNCNTCMDKILEFLNLKEYESDSDKYLSEWQSTKDFTLFEFQAWIGKWMEVLDPNNIKWRKKQW